MFIILPEKSLNNQILVFKVIVKSLFLIVFIELDTELSLAIKDGNDTPVAELYVVCTYLTTRNYVSTTHYFT